MMKKLAALFLLFSQLAYADQPPMAIENGGKME
jgi:hypothetical protein